MLLTSITLDHAPVKNKKPWSAFDHGVLDHGDGVVSGGVVKVLEAGVGDEDCQVLLCRVYQSVDEAFGLNLL